MSTDDNTAENTHEKIAEDLHRDLCAWLLGELEGDEARAVEEALAASPALRAERERLESTMELVRGAYSEEPALSERALGELLARAEGGGNRRPAPWWSRPMLRAAAAVLVTVGGVAGILAVERAQRRNADTTVARAPAMEKLVTEEEPRPATIADGLAFAEPADSARGVELKTADKLRSEPATVAGSVPGVAGRKFGEAVKIMAPIKDSGIYHYEAGTWTRGRDAAGLGEVVFLDSEQEISASGGYTPTPEETAKRELDGRLAAIRDQTTLAEGEALADLPAADARRAPARSLKEDLAGLGYAGGEEELEELEEVEVLEERRDASKESLGRARTAIDGDDAYHRLPRTVLTDADLEAYARRTADEFFLACRRYPKERPRDMFFRFWGDNPFEYTPQDPQSTFSVDVDTASYALARRYLDQGLLPEKAQVRTEEFLNYFDADLPAPTESTFAVHTELAPSRFGGADDRWMLRVGVRGREIPREERQPLALTFVIDTSGSMREGNRLELVKHAMRLLLGELDARDSIAIVAFSSESRLILPMTSADKRALIETAIHHLSPDGSTNAEAGLKLGYELALTAIDPGIHSRVILLSDGVANTGETDQDRITHDVTRHRQQGIYLNTVGVGMNNHNDVFLEQLADKGDGVCDYVDTPDAAQRALVERFTGALIPIASDVKIQVEFEEESVARYRLLGYENRAIADADFRNDQVDAGEVGSGHQVVALFELELTGSEPDLLATVRVRWKAPKQTGQHPLEIDVTEVEHPVRYAQAAGSFEATSPGYRRSVVVAQFAENLRRSTHARGDSLEELVQEAEKLRPQLSDPEFDELVGLVRRAEGMLLEERVREMADELGMTLREYKRLVYQRALLEELTARGERSSELLQQIRAENEALEQKIRGLIRQELGR